MEFEQKFDLEKDYILRLTTAQSIVDRFKLQKYIKVLCDYWSQYPPTAGHGFAHAVGVGVESYQFGVNNAFSKPEYLFLGGLYHDIYRPAEGKHGEEDQTPGADVVQKLFTENDLDSDAMNLITAAIKSHDSWRTEENPPEFDLFLSLGDKAMMDTLLSDSYVWINNRKRQIAGRNPVYSSHIETLSSFYKYQIRAWEIMMKFNKVKGLERSRNAYIDTVRMTIAKYKEDPKGEHFNEWMDQQKNRMESLELMFLKTLGIENDTINKVLQLYRI